MYTKPKQLKRGDTIGVVSPSWGGPATFPHIYENGLKALQKLGFKIKEFSNTRADADVLWRNPKTRAKDLNAAFADPEVKGIITSIGGNDSVRILPFLDKELMQKNPKFFLGYSDTTTIHLLRSQLGLVTFYGPSVMAGLSQMESLPQEFEKHVREFLFEKFTNYEYHPYSSYCDGYSDWNNKENTGKINTLKKADGWRWLQGKGVTQGELAGGCLEVLEMVKATDFWPPKDFWQGKILILETSETKSSLHVVDHVLRNYGAQGVYGKIAGLLFARARDYSDQEKKKLDEKILSIVAGEFGRSDLPIVSNMDFGHTDPQLVLPLGARADINSDQQTFRLLESPYAIRTL